MKIHQTQIEKYSGTLSQLAVEIGDLRYDVLAEFLQALSLKIAEDGTKDQERGRAKLAKRLSNCSIHIRGSAKEIEEAWVICEPFTK